MRILFVHQNFPGQFRHIAAHMAAHHEVVAIGRTGCPGLPGVRLSTYVPHRRAADATHHYVRTMEEGVITGQAVLRLMLVLKAEGFVPDVIVAHPGWGETLFAKEAFPAAKLVHLCEFFYRGQGADLGFDPEFPPSLDDRARVRTRNGLHLLSLDQCDAGVAPTQWQRSLFPPAYQHKIHVAHEGVNTYPFVLSWSLLEAMAAGCLVIASRTAPVEEVITHGRDGLLTDFFDPEALAATIASALESQQALAPLRRSASALVRSHYGIAAGVQAYERIIAGVVGTAQSFEVRQAPTPAQAICAM